MMRFRWAAPVWAGVLLLVVAGMALYLIYGRPGAPERRAELFIETLIVMPDNTEVLVPLAVLAPGTTPESLVTGVAARTALAYLRARARLGARLRIDSQDSHLLADHQQVVVTAREGVAGGETIRFQVTLVERDDEWRVARVGSE